MSPLSYPLVHFGWLLASGAAAYPKATIYSQFWNLLFLQKEKDGEWTKLRAG
jgi:hypothetical protein